jgi:uncharacterized protein YegL
MGLGDYGNNQIARRPLEFIWILDVSGSMAGDKIQSLNNAIRDCIPAMKEVADDNVNAEIFIRALIFGTQSGNGVSWHISNRTPVEQFTWSDVRAEGMTPLGAALKEISKVLDVNTMPERGLPPVLVLITDGQPNDSWEQPLQDLLALPWGKKAVKIGIAIGDDCEEDVIRRFINNNEISVLRAQSAKDLVTYIKWVSTQVLAATSSPKSVKGGGQASIQMPTVQKNSDDDDVIF